MITGSQTLLINNIGGGTLNWDITTDESWLNCTPTSGTEAGVVSVTADATGLATGTYNASITISAPGTSNPIETITVLLTVYNPGATTSPFGYFETPLDNSTVRSSIPITGWVLDDIETTSVEIHRAPLAGESGMVYIGEAVFVDGARPDVEQANSTAPKNYQAGWGYMMHTNFLPDQGNGTFTLYAIAIDKEGNSVNLGSKTINVDNANAVLQTFTGY